MMFAKLVLVVLLPISLSKATDVTFKNARFEKELTVFKTIQFSNSLKDFLPESSDAYRTDVNFSNQSIPVLYEGSLADIDLFSLVLENCSIYEIRPGFLRNATLSEFSLKGNKIEKIEKGVFHKVDVTWIDLSHNRITTIHSKAFDNLRNMWGINLSYNNIQNWNPNLFRNTPDLRSVDLRKNSISQVPNHAFKNLEGIRIDSSQETVYVDIDLSYNKIKAIEPDAFNGLTRVGDLELNNNQLEDFDEDLLQDVYVKNLDLSNNKISCLKGDLAKILKAGETDLSRNPFDCACLSRIKEWRKKNKKKVTIYTSHSIRKC